MKIYTTVIAAMFGLMMMAMPTVASAEVLVRCDRWWFKRSSRRLRSRPSSTIGRGHAPTRTTAITTGGAAVNRPAAR